MFFFLEQVKCNHTFYFDQYRRNNQIHLSITNSTYKVEATHIKYNFENLYNGEKLLGDNVNLVMNDNWKEVFDAVRPKYEKAFNLIFQKIVVNILEKVPVSEIFL